MAASRVVTQRLLSTGYWQSKYSINYREVASACHKDQKESLRLVLEDFPRSHKPKIQTLTEEQI